MSIEHVDITTGEVHEPKGVDAATAGTVYVADGAGGGIWRNLAGTLVQGVYDYNDLTTASTPIPLTAANTLYELTNDGAGAFTNKTYALPALADLWNVATDRFDFTGLSLGDTVDIRFDVEYTTGTTNTDINLDLELGIGAAPYTLSVLSNKDHSASGTYQEVHMFSIYMGDVNTLNNPARVLASASKTGTTVKVNGWYIRPIHTN